MKFEKELKEELISEITSFGGFIFYIFNLGIFLVLEKFDYFLFLFLGLFLILFISSLIRLFYFKNRPKKQSRGKNLLSRIDASSFPSVHAQRITLLSLFYMNLINNIFFWILLIIVMFSVLYSRYYLKKHYLVDLVFGVLLSIIYFILLNMILM